MINFGLLARGDSSNVQLDSEYGVLNVLAEGSYAGYGSTSGAGTLITFAAPVTTQAPPLMFLNPDMAAVNAGRVDLSLVRPVGTPGNWTGFRVRGRNVQYAHTGKYFAAGMRPDLSEDSFGLRLWNGSREKTFDSGQKMARLIGPAGVWTYKGSFTTTTGLLAQGWKTPWLFGDDAYFMVSPFATELVVSNQQRASIGVEFTKDKTEVNLWLTTLPGAWTGNNFWMPALGGKISG